ncbi:hypothetical protein K502DRAFT_349184 [Neoconidiobolus thromboides FSU 785]|nr:hypothetical protein K502DRAFT_349184 [Neoconidiobolus thromboides FSU 785]
MKPIDLPKRNRRDRSINPEYLILSYQYTLKRDENEEITFKIEDNKNNHEAFKMPNRITKLMSSVFNFKLSERSKRSLVKAIILPQKHFNVLQHLNTILKEVINSYNGRSISPVYCDNLLNKEDLEFSFDFFKKSAFSFTVIKN